MPASHAMPRRGRRRGHAPPTRDAPTPATAQTAAPPSRRSLRVLARASARGEAITMSTAPAPARGPARAPTPTPTPTPATPRRTPSPPPAAAPDTWTPHPLVRNGTVPDPPPAWWFSESVYHVLQQIPRGRATTYGHIAALAGFPRHARQVGVWLREYGDDGDGEAESAPDDDGDGAEDSGDSGAAASTAASWRMPWHRVVAAGGRIAPRAPHAQMALQASRLDAEGVAVVPVDVGGGLETTWRIVHWPAVRWCPSPDGGAGTAST